MARFFGTISFKDASFLVAKSAQKTTIGETTAAYRMPKNNSPL